MIAYHYHHETRLFLGSSPADPDPRRPGGYLYPGDSINVAPPDFDHVIQQCRWTGDDWVVEPIPVPEPEEEAAPVEELP